jgi:hypothetical protein
MIGMADLAGETWEGRREPGGRQVEVLGMEPSGRLWLRLASDKLTSFQLLLQRAGRLLVRHPGLVCMAEVLPGRRHLVRRLV